MQGVGVPDLIMPSAASPHEYSLRPSEAGAIQAAEVVFWMGRDLTPWLENALETLAPEAERVALLESEATTLLAFREGALFDAHDHGDHDGHEHGDDHGHEHVDDHGHEHAHSDEHHGHEHAEHGGEDHDHATHGHGEKRQDHAHDDHGHEDHAEDAAHGGHGHDHDGIDPHAWLAPHNAKAWLGLIAETLAHADPENAATYRANAETGVETLTTLEAEIETILAPVRDGRFVVFHDAYQYFERAFAFEASGAISLSDATDPSPARVAEIQARVRDEDISCVLAEPQFNPGLVDTVLAGSEVRSGVIDPIGAELEPGPDLYPTMLRNMAQVLANCL
ncbi:metal ABC transporter solute-binding protein, Zn/Mn family [Cognatishimia sp. F0-27]|uniref:zinc ABC transporter substrate-binding protein n=1 Tax=Cognatishimia sp. F0-27 TaxID=2816855 RepID=UPI00351D3525